MPPIGFSGPSECGVTNPARRRRTNRRRYRRRSEKGLCRISGAYPSRGSIIETSRDDALDPSMKIVI